MTKQGIITGIGNTITPQIDAVLNDFIVGGNAIISGLSLTNGTLTAGMCQLCGYRGVLESAVPVPTNEKNIYGKFEINYGNGEDKFSIFTSSTEPTDGIINPTSITTNGTYYLRLYTNGVRDNLLVSNYPYSANTSEKSMQLIANGRISSTATTPTEKDDKGNVVVDLHNSQPARVANTEYAHNQIIEELGYEKKVVDISRNGVGYNLTFEKRARYCLISYNISLQNEQGVKTEFQVPSGFEPADNRETIIYIKGYTNVQYVYKLYVTTAGVASIVDVSFGGIAMATPSMGTLYAGYKI